jgi:hypothetical protein
MPCRTGSGHMPPASEVRTGRKRGHVKDAPKIRLDPSMQDIKPRPRPGTCSLGQDSSFRWIARPFMI